MGVKTLREISDEFHVSRRAVQGYEKAGLVKASGKTERGYLLYDEKMQERIQQIKLYQEMGFSINEISNIIDAPKEVLKKALENQVIKLKEKKGQFEILIGKANRLISRL